MRKRSQKTRERLKKGVCILVAASLAVSGLAAAVPALASADTVIKVQSSTSDNRLWKCYQVFSAQYKDETRATHVQWSVGSGIASGIVEWLDSADSGFDAKSYTEWIKDTGKGTGKDKAVEPKDRSNAQNALEYIGHALDSASTNPAVGSHFFEMRLARYIAEHVSSTRSVTEGVAESLDDGWWLLASDDAQPMFIAANGKEITADAKSNLPTIEKYIGENASSGIEYGAAADAGVKQDVPYRVSMRLPNNIDSFESYKLNAYVNHPTNLEIDESSVTVTLEEVSKIKHADNESIGVNSSNSSSKLAGLGDQPSSSNKENTDAGYATLSSDIAQLYKGFEVTNASGQLCVSFDNLLDAAPLARMTDDVQIRIDYNAQLAASTNANGSSALGAFNATADSAYMEYSSTPISDEMATSASVGTKLYSWGIKINKTDKEGKRLSGAEFTLKDANGKFWNGNGFGDKASAKTLKSDEAGEIAVDGVDHADYTLTETKAPKGYKAVEGDMTISITAEMGDYITLSARADGAEVQKVEAGNGIVHVHVSDERINNSSGKNDTINGKGYDKTGIDIMLVIAAVLAVGCVVLWVMRRRHKAQQAANTPCQ